MSNEESELSFYSQCLGAEAAEISFGPRDFDHSRGAVVRRAADDALFFVKSIEPWTVAEAEDPAALTALIKERLGKYISRLRAAGVNTPDHYDVKLVWKSGTPLACEVASYCGQDLAKTLLSCQPEAAAPMVKSMIRQTVSAVGCSGLGIDSHPSNWAKNGSGEVVYIDFWPVRYAEAGTFLVGFPQPQEYDLVTYVASRYYTLPGVMRILRFNLARAADHLEEIFFDHAKQIVGADEIDDIFGALPEVFVRQWLRERQLDKIALLIDSLDEFQIDELREIALRLVPDDPVRLTELFELTHMDFRIPAEERARRLARFKEELITMVRLNC